MQENSRKSQGLSHHSEPERRDHTSPQSGKLGASVPVRINSGQSRYLGKVGHGELFGCVSFVTRVKGHLVQDQILTIS